MEVCGFGSASSLSELDLESVGGLWPYIVNRGFPNDLQTCSGQIHVFKSLVKFQPFHPFLLITVSHTPLAGTKSHTREGRR